MVDLWVVNADLPHVSGTELCTMLKSGAHSGAVYLVANAYSATIERQALAARATLFACKPLHASLFDTWLSHQGQRRTAEARPLPAVREANSIR
jgi:response regulator RpfG family c-di-GMP phosphodiesterase